MERVVRLAYPTAGAEVADDIGRYTLVTGLHNGELRMWVHQARPQSFKEARASGHEEDQGVVHAVSAQEPGGLDHLSQMLECILAWLDSGGVAPPQRPGHFKCDISTVKYVSYDVEVGCLEAKRKKTLVGQST